MTSEVCVSVCVRACVRACLYVCACRVSLLMNAHVQCIRSTQHTGLIYSSFPQGSLWLSVLSARLAPPLTSSLQHGSAPWQDLNIKSKNL